MRTLSKFSNYGQFTNVAGQRKAHDNRFVLPGGDDDPAGPEGIGAFGSEQARYGTSYAAAYASAVVAAVISQQGVGSYDRASVIEYLQKSADKTYGTYDAQKHGRGILRV
jgi:hypothetical protein